MKIRWFMLLLLGAIGGLTACNRQTVSSAPPSPNSPESPTATAVAPSPKAQGSSTAQASAQGIAPVPVPELIPPTGSTERLPQVEAGRADPFASLPMTPTIVPKPESVQPAVPVAANPAAPTVIPLPPITISAPAPVVQPAAPAVLPSLPVPVSPTQLAEAIEISGVMQVGDKTNIIIKAPDESTSRSVRVGDILANGQVRVKRVVMGAEPTVILEQNGREVTRSIGSGALIGSI